jgi:hypothetical protein
MSDKEETAASLGNSEVLSVQSPVADAIPELGKRPEDGRHVTPTVVGEDRLLDGFLVLQDVGSSSMGISI